MVRNNLSAAAGPITIRQYLTKIGCPLVTTLLSSKLNSEINSSPYGHTGQCEFSLFHQIFNGFCFYLMRKKTREKWC